METQYSITILADLALENMLLALASNIFSIKSVKNDNAITHF
jgi:hypothetical protein